MPTNSDGNGNTYICADTIAYTEISSDSGASSVAPSACRDCRPTRARAFDW